jgi:hypothetical protein
MADLSHVTPSTKNARRCGSALAIVLTALGATGCGAGLDAGIDYPDMPDIDHFLRTPENQTGPAIAFNSVKVTSEACPNIDTHPVTQKLAQDELTKFFEAQGIHVPVKKARSNLYWYDVPNGERGGRGFVRLRLAVLDSQPLASADLHQSLLEHGPGWWGVRRSNLAVLAPKTSLHEAMAFAIKYKLVCWGMFTYAGVDDAYVVPGPYGEI